MQPSIVQSGTRLDLQPSHARLFQGWAIASCRHVSGEVIPTFGAGMGLPENRSGGGGGALMQGPKFWHERVGSSLHGRLPKVSTFSEAPDVRMAFRQ